MQRNLNLLLCLVAVLGLALFVRERTIVRKLRLESDRLARLYRRPVERDCKNYIVKRVESSLETAFAWHVYFPRGLAIGQKSIWAVGGNSSQPSEPSWGGGRPGQFVVRCGLEFAANGIVLDTNWQSGKSAVGNAKLSRFIDEHWDELDVALLADGEYGTEQVLSFVKIDLPSELVDELASSMPDFPAEQLAAKPFFELQLGTQVAFDTVAQPEGAER